LRVNLVVGVQGKETVCRQSNCKDHLVRRGFVRAH